MSEVQMGPIVKVARILREIETLFEALLAQAIHKASAHIDGSSLPGGDAMIALGPVANREAWENMQETSERTGLKLTAPELEDERETPLQRILYWSERWRRHHGAEYGQTPNLSTEVSFIRWNLEWATVHEPQWQQFAADMAQAQADLETILNAGRRDIVSTDVACLLCETPLRRRMTDTDGYEDEWWCGQCHVHLTHPQFNLAASESARRSLGLV